ncbi:uncharacterized protein [Sinocyclocheilus grahami]|uniref:uncharacterized protein n=1 Tax=Sinocyclocheilus grahami TaxID=75366 RepID=UPI0007ACC196|nr:PREDICTED: uncharacterized protein LOC107553244 [Sinocyclocheilus grahami]
MEEAGAGNGAGTQGCELERSGDGGLDEVQMHLACLPERYMRAKFSLSAYIFCWTVVKLCQRLRPSPVLPQAPALEDSGSEAACLDDGESQQEEQGEQQDHQEWCEPVPEAAQDTKEEYFDTHSWPSDTFSESSHETKDCCRTPLSYEVGSCSMGHLDTHSPFVKPSPLVRGRNPSSTKQHHSVNHADSLCRTVDREQLQIQTGNMGVMHMGVDGTGMSQAKGALECEEVFNNSPAEPEVDSSSRNGQSYVVAPLLALENSVEPQTLTEPCANDSLLTLTDSDGAKFQFADTFEGKSKWDQINKNITNTQSGHNEPQIQFITSSEKQLQQNDIDSSNTEIQLISNASVANSKDAECHELGVDENKISLSVSRHLFVYESVSVEKPIEQKVEESTKHSHSQPSVEHSQSQSSVEHSKSQASAEHNQSQDSVECSQSHNSAEHSKLQDSAEHSQSQALTEDRPSQDFVEHSRSQDSVEHSRSQDSVEHSQSPDSVEHSQSQDSVECSQSQNSLNSRNNEYSSDTNNNIKAITLEECASGEQISLPNSLQKYSRVTSNAGSLVSKGGDCKDSDSYSAPASQATPFKAPEMRMAMNGEDNVAKPSEFNECSSYRNYILKQLCDCSGGKDCQLHSSALEGEQTSGGFQLKGTDGISQSRTAVLQTLSHTHTDDHYSTHGEVNADSTNCEFSHIGHLLAHKHPELVQEKSILPLVGGSLKVDDTYALENMERKLEAFMANSPESTDSICETSDPLCKQSLQLHNSEIEDTFVTCCRILPITNLEAILELDRSPESSFVTKNGLEQQRGSPLSEVGFSEEWSSCDDVTTRPHVDVSAMWTKASVATVMNEPDAGETMNSLSNGFDSSDGYSVSSFVSQDLDSSTNSEEMEDSTQSSSSLHGSARNKRTQSGKGSVFSVFSRIPSFRKIKWEHKGNNKVDPEIKDSNEDGDERNEVKYNRSLTRNKSNPSLYNTPISHSTDHLTDISKFVDHSNDDIFEEAFSLNLHNREQYVQCQNLYQQQQQHKDGDVLKCRASPMTEGLQQKRSKSTDNLNLRMKLAIAHKSLSSLFESRYPERDNQEQISQSENEEVKTKQSWRKMKRSKEAELYKRTLSVPGTTCDKSIHQSHIDCAFCAHQNRSRLNSSLASQKSLMNQCHSDSQSLKSGPQSDDSKCLEGGELPCAPYSDSEVSVDGFEANVEERSQSPVHPTVFALANQISPTWTRSLSCFETTDTPTRPMSPKPHSPGLGWTHQRSFRYPSRSVASSLCSLGQGVSTDGLSDPPLRPTSLKPRTAQLTTAHSFDSECLLEDSSSDSQSQNSLNSASLINKPEVRQRQL